MSQQEKNWKVAQALGDRPMDLNHYQMFNRCPGCSGETDLIDDVNWIGGKHARCRNCKSLWRPCVLLSFDQVKALGDRGCFTNKDVPNFSLVYHTDHPPTKELIDEAFKMLQKAVKDFDLKGTILPDGAAVQAIFMADPFIRDLIAHVESNRTRHYGNHNPWVDFPARIADGMSDNFDAIMGWCIGDALNYLRRFPNTRNPVDLLKAADFLRALYYLVEESKQKGSKHGLGTDHKP